MAITDSGDHMQTSAGITTEITMRVMARIASRVRDMGQLGDGHIWPSSNFSTIGPSNDHIGLLSKSGIIGPRWSEVRGSSNKLRTSEVEVGWSLAWTKTVQGGGQAKPSTDQDSPRWRLGRVWLRLRSDLIWVNAYNTCPLPRVPPTHGSEVELGWKKVDLQIKADTSDAFNASHSRIPHLDSCSAMYNLLGHRILPHPRIKNVDGLDPWDTAQDQWGGNTWPKGGRQTVLKLEPSEIL